MIGTCSSEEKEEILKVLLQLIKKKRNISLNLWFKKKKLINFKSELLQELGCDRVINYKEENVAGVLATEYEVKIILQQLYYKIFVEFCIPRFMS